MIKPNFNTLKSQSGAVLLVSLIMLLLLTLIGVTGMQTAGLEEKMAGNMRDRNIAFQAAEAALRDAERDIRGERISTATKHKDYDQTTQQPFDGLSGFLVDCGKSTTDITDDGLCIGDPAKKPWGTESDMTGAPSVEYGKFTGATALGGGLSAQPRYLIEVFKKNVSGDNSCKFYHRITARAQGMRDSTVVLLQEVVRWCL